MIGALEQTVEIPLWLLVTFLAYSEKRIVRILEPLRKKIAE